MRSASPLAVSVLALLVAGCTITEVIEGPGGGGPAAPSGSGTGPDGKKAITPGTRFDAEPASWNVPEGGFAQVGFNSVSSGAWATMDLDGDDKPDLVVPADPTASSSKVWGFGKQPYWKLYKNTGSGFGEESQWTVPVGGFAAAGFNDVAAGKWATMDLDGDHKPDLVVPSDPAAQSPKVFGSSGSPYWKVYKNTGSGFGEETEWSVPTGGFATVGFNGVASGRWVTMDLDGDGKPDLVVPSDPAAESAKVHGYGKQPYWKVYKNTGAGFGEETQWTVPVGGFASVGFNNVASGRWATMDLDGDGKPELVVPSDPAAESAKVHGLGAEPYWKVYKNTGTGFGEETRWSVPEGGFASVGFNNVASGRWVTMDLDGDRRPDLVVPSDPAAESAKVHGLGDEPHWKIYKNTGSGFAQETRWAVPQGGFASVGFNNVASGRWATTDLDGDGRPDLVLPADPVADTARVWGLGSGPFWKVYKGTP